MKKIINRAETVVAEMCGGIALAQPELEFVKKYKIIKKKRINKRKVSLISGGGAGMSPPTPDSWAGECWMRPCAAMFSPRLPKSRSIRRSRRRPASGELC